MSIFLIKFKNDRNNDVPPINKIEFGTLDPFDLNISVKNLNKVHINNKSYYNVRGNFTLWFNNLDIEKSKVDYSTIDLKSYINGVKPVNICIENEEYNLFFTKEDYLIVFYNNIYIMYDLKQADILLESFISSF